MLIRVKERKLNKKNRKNREREKRWIKRRERREKKSFGKVGFLIMNSSVEVDYGFSLFHSKLLIANDMCWVVL